MSLTSPHFDSADVERIRTQIMSGLRSESSSPSALAGRKFLQVAFGDHPYGRPAGGTLESVPEDRCRRSQGLRPSAYWPGIRLRIAVVGDVDASHAWQTARPYLRRPARKSQPHAGRRRRRHAKPPRRAFIPLDVPQTVVTFGGPGHQRRHDPDFMAGYVRESGPRRQRVVIPALSRSPRETRPGLFDL